MVNVAHGNREGVSGIHKRVPKFVTVAALAGLASLSEPALAQRIAFNGQTAPVPAQRAADQAPAQAVNFVTVNGLRFDVSRPADRQMRPLTLSQMEMNSQQYRFTGNDPLSGIHFVNGEIFDAARGYGCVLNFPNFRVIFSRDLGGSLGADFINANGGHSVLTRSSAEFEGAVRAVTGQPVQRVRMYVESTNFTGTDQSYAAVYTVAADPQTGQPIQTTLNGLTGYLSFAYIYTENTHSISRAYAFLVPAQESH